MRKFLWLAAALPSVCLADQFVLDAPVTHVTMHPTGATVERRVPFSIPAGTHELILRGADPAVPLTDLRLSVAGAMLETLAARRSDLPPRAPAERPEVAAARAKVKRIEREIRDLEDRRAAHLLEVAAARAKQAFLAGLGERDGIASQDVISLREISAMIAEETLAAKTSALAAQQAARALDDPLADLTVALERARQALAALVPDTAEPAELTLTVTAPAPAEGQVTVSYLTPEAMWQPGYEARLTRGERPRLVLSRVAWVAQDGGETWRDVALRLSTVDPEAPTDPSVILPLRRRITERREEKSLGRAEMSGAAPEPMVEPMVEVQADIGSLAAVGAALDGISVTYDYPRPVTLAPGTDAVRIPLGEIALDAEVFARATPRHDETAFVAAGFTNDTQEILLPSDRVHLYLDGTFVGLGRMPIIAAGEETELSFGPIEGLRLKTVVTGRNEGDRGVLSKSNELTEARTFEVANLTGTEWQVRLRDRVPYSEQEDLVIDWTATPRPETRDVDGRRGVLEWRFPLAPGAQQAIRLEQRLTWPDGYELR
ncbi:DUF4139 domain-containing protein [Antarcticimicrobium luteum]|uniref:Mucoidy inhibitor MuiA family protein n=1 Tax=Antarcticimicrobium luteum TaxID=2547397 RepID=A0A4R5V4K5_9RHOB|nr:DUF4139 domain-containing protein [Antarcticimicrobium luteum]TDK46819.1 mucoidy inhibitor MuiA family protein [Antarcticimicrobium luteum]